MGWLRLCRYQQTRSKTWADRRLRSPGFIWGSYSRINGFRADALAALLNSLIQTRAKKLLKRRKGDNEGQTA